MRIRLTRTVTFRASHRLFDAARTAEENRGRFGWTVEPHSHQYTCRVTVTGPVDDDEAMVMDLGLLDRLLAEEVVTRFEGKRLDQEIPEFWEVLPTCEALARDVFRRLGARLPPDVSLVAVRLAEDPTLSAECVGDG